MADNPVAPADDVVGPVTPADFATLAAQAEAARGVTFEQTIYEDGKLTYDGMRRVLLRGGSVSHNGRIINTPEGLPSEAQLAAGDAAKTIQVKASIAARRAALDAEEALLGEQPAQPVPHIAYGMTGNVVPGKRGEGDTAGIDGDLSNPDSVAAKNAQAQAEAQAAADKAQAEALAAEAAAALAAAQPPTDDKKAGSSKKEG